MRQHLMYASPITITMTSITVRLYVAEVNDVAGLAAVGFAAVFTFPAKHSIKLNVKLNCKLTFFCYKDLTSPILILFCFKLLE